MRKGLEHKASIAGNALEKFLFRSVQFIKKLQGEVTSHPTPVRASICSCTPYVYIKLVSESVTLGHILCIVT